jgi:UPF0716 protein FxsA
MVLLLLVVLPILEIIVAFVVAHFIGWWLTLGLLLVLSLVGGWQIKVQGVGAWRRARDEVRAGRSPARSVLDGGLRLTGAFLLAAPGFVSALIALPFLLAPSRKVLAGQAEVWTVVRLRVPFMVVSGVGRAGGAVIRSRSSGVVDVEGWEDPAHDPQRGAPTALPRPAPPKD